MSIKKLPAEVLTNIASRLDDCDLTSFRLICRETNQVFVDDSSTVWPLLFNKKYDRILRAPFDLLRWHYVTRTGYLTKGCKYIFDGTSKRERRCVSKLIELIVGSYGHPPLQSSAEGCPPHSKNLDEIEKFARRYRLFDNYITLPLQASVLARAASDGGLYFRLVTTQVVLTHLRFKDEHDFAALSDIPQCQQAVYAPARLQPIFHKDYTINTRWLACTINLFRHYCLYQQPDETYDSYHELPYQQRPRAWQHSLCEGQKSLGRRWLGIYCSMGSSPVEPFHCTDELTRTPGGPVLNGEDVEGPPATFPQDAEDAVGSFPDGNPFEQIQFGPLEELDIHEWPGPFEEHLRVFTHPLVEELDGFEQTTSMVPTEPGIDTSGKPVAHGPQPVDSGKLQDWVRQGHFLGESWEQGWLSLYRGWVTPWKSQADIPGWQRITMMKFSPPMQPGETLPASGIGGEEHATLKRPYSQYARILRGEDVIEDGNTYCMEGVCLPGGQIIVGRWWAPHHTDPEAGVGLPQWPRNPIPPTDALPMSGPFMLWCIDGYQGAIHQ